MNSVHDMPGREEGRDIGSEGRVAEKEGGKEEEEREGAVEDGGREGEIEGRSEERTEGGREGGKTDQQREGYSRIRSVMKEKPS